MKAKHLIYCGLILLVIALVVIPLVMHTNSAFTGTDDNAVGLVHELNPNYLPWYKSVLPPISAEISSMLFALQAAIGAGALGYGIGYIRGRKK